MNKIYLENDESTNKLGALISEKLKEIKKSSIEIHLEGDLGAGKTFLTRSIISNSCLLYTSPSPRDTEVSRMPSSA